MKSALVYLLLTRLKAQFKEMVRKPARLIYLVLVIALFAITLLGGGEAGGAARDARELPALAGAFYGLMFVILVSAGFKNGASMFTLSDVNLLFPAPIRPRAVLYYGLFRQLGASLLLGLFLLFQYGWLHSLYGVGVGILILIVVLYGVSVFLAQVVAMAAYSLTSMSPRRRALAEGLIYGVLGAFLVAVAGARGARPGRHVAFFAGGRRRFAPVPPHARGRVDGGDAARGDDGRLYHACRLRGADGGLPHRRGGAHRPLRP